MAGRMATAAMAATEEFCAMEMGEFIRKIPGILGKSVKWLDPNS